MKKIFMCIFALLAITGVAFAGSYDAAVNPIRYIEQTVTAADMTDVTTTGTLTMTDALPVGAIVIAWRAVVTVPFTGDTSAVLLVGITGDTDRFSASDGQSIFAAGTVADSGLGEAVGCDGVGTATSVLLTVTTASDFTSTPDDASFNIKVYYLAP